MEDTFGGLYYSYRMSGALYKYLNPNDDKNATACEGAFLNTLRETVTNA